MASILAFGCDIVAAEHGAVVGDGFHAGHGGAGFASV